MSISELLRHGIAALVAASAITIGASGCGDDRPSQPADAAADTGGADTPEERDTRSDPEDDTRPADVAEDPTPRDAGDDAEDATESDAVDVADVPPEVVEGPGDAPARARLPDIAFPDPVAADFDWDGDGDDGVGTSRVEIAIVLDEGARVDDVNGLLHRFGATLVGSTPDALLLLLRFPDEGLDASWLRLGRLLDEELVVAGFVESAVMGVEELPASVVDHAPVGSDPGGDPTSIWHVEALPSGGNWGLKAIRAPQAWNLRDGVRRSGAHAVVLAAIDNGFDTLHADLPTTLNTSPSNTAEAHGTGVVGIMAGKRDDGAGVTGVFPFDVPFEAVVLDGARSMDLRRRVVTARALDDLVRVSRDTSVRVVNNSYGSSQTYEDRCINPEISIYPGTGRGTVPLYTWRDVVDLYGDAYHAAAQALVRSQPAYPRGWFVWVASAGNGGLPAELRDDGHDCAQTIYVARDNSAIANAAIRYPLTHYAAVGAAHPDGSPTVFSNRSPSFFAPGIDLRIAYHPEAYSVRRGTSFAAPHGAGAIAYLLTLYPLPISSPAQVLRAIDETLTTADGLDLFAAAMQLDVLLGGTLQQIRLADMDDGTLDGNLRREIWREGCRAVPDSAECASTPPSVRGDDRVDLRDFRVLRDAILYASALDLPFGDSPLDGPANHPAFDLNRDGCVTAILDGVPVPGATVSCTPSTAETEYPRADLNGDGRLSATRTAPFQGADLSDLEVFQGVFPSGRDPVTHGFVAADLPSLLGSGDVHVDLSVLAARGAERAVLSLDGVPAAVEIERVTSHAAVLSTPWTSTATLRARGITEGAEFVCLQVELEPPGAGVDVVATPDVACYDCCQSDPDALDFACESTLCLGCVCSRMPACCEEGGWTASCAELAGSPTCDGACGCPAARECDPEVAHSCPPIGYYCEGNSGYATGPGTCVAGTCRYGAATWTDCSDPPPGSMGGFCYEGVCAYTK